MADNFDLQDRFFRDVLNPNPVGDRLARVGSGGRFDTVVEVTLSTLGVRFVLRDTALERGHVAAKRRDGCVLFGQFRLHFRQADLGIRILHDTRCAHEEKKKSTQCQKSPGCHRVHLGFEKARNCR